MLKKIAQFIKYNSLVVAVIAIAFVAVASAMADENTRNKIIGEEIVEKSGVDNTVLLAADLENFDMEMQITGVAEDPPEVEDGNYYIDYQYKTLAIKDSVWREVLITKQMTVSKRSLEGRDLGLYVMEELGEIIDYQLAYLKEVQENETDKGVTVVLETTEYTGLIGLVLDTKTKELPGYEPVVQPEVAEVAENDGNIIDDDFEEEETSWLHSGDSPAEPDCNSAPQPSGTMEPADEEPPLTPPSQGGETEYPDDAAYWEQMEINCLDDGGFWYNEICNTEEEPATDTATDVGAGRDPPLQSEEDPPADDTTDEPATDDITTEPATDAGADTATEPTDDDAAVSDEPAEDDPPAEDKPAVEAGNNK